MSIELEDPRDEQRESSSTEVDRFARNGRTPAPSLQSFLDGLLADQQQLQTPVARFAENHSSLVTRHSSFHSDLIPLTAPSAGEQYAFEVDLDSCSGCKACVAGCHSLNGLDEHETWRDVGLVLGGDAVHPFQQTVTTACHHCADPGCLNGCPVLAYEKDPVTGIVRHLDDQCIGCSYCILKCPYDVPKFSKRLGIVRKCDMCHGRLAAGEAPACVQACPTHAIRIVKVEVSEISNPRPGIENSQFLPVAPDASYTRPTTRYVTKRGLPANLRAADATTLRLQPAHWPLVLMLVLTQASIGFCTSHGITPGSGDHIAFLLALSTGGIGLAASVAHLGQPLRAWRVFLGWRRSWLSREAMLLGGYMGMLASVPVLTIPALLPATIATGLLAVLCSIMIYVDTRRHFWRPVPTFIRMGGTVAVAATAMHAPLVAASLLLLKLACEAWSLRGSGMSARLQRGPLWSVVMTRFALGGSTLALFVSGPIVGALALWLLGEFAERHLYFRAVDAPKMPGKPA